MEENLSLIRAYVNFIDYGWGEIQQGQTCGSIKLKLNDYLLEEIPLIADRNVEKAGFITSLSDRLILKIWKMGR